MKMLHQTQVLLWPILLFILLASSSAKAECGKETYQALRTDVAAATITNIVSSCRHVYTRIYLLIETDGDGGDFVYNVKNCPDGTGMTCQAFSSAITGTLTVGGTAFVWVNINEPFKHLEIQITTNDALATVYVEQHP